MHSQMPLGFFIYRIRSRNRVPTSVTESSEWHVSSSNLAREETL